MSGKTDLDERETDLDEWEDGFGVSGKTDLDEREDGFGVNGKRFLG